MTIYLYLYRNYKFREFVVKVFDLLHLSDPKCEDMVHEIYKQNYSITSEIDNYLRIGYTMTNDTITSAEKRRNEALQVFKDYPGKIALGIQEKILDQQVVYGMTPHEAYLAAGEFTFKVIPDKSKWQGNPDPYKVMWSQSVDPDDSDIWMTFASETQYPDEGLTKFEVYFKGGKALIIKKL